MTSGAGSNLGIAAANLQWVCKSHRLTPTCPDLPHAVANKDTVLSDLVEMLTNIQDVNDVRDFTAEISETIAYGRKQSATLEEAHQEDTVAEPDLMEAARDNDDAAKAPSSDVRIAAFKPLHRTTPNAAAFTTVDSSF